MPYIYLIAKQMLRNFLFFQEPKFYNSLESEIANTNSICSFKKALNKKIMTNYK